MRHIVYCWEIGAGLGHIVPMAKIAAAMVKQGNKVTCVLTKLTHAPKLLAPLGIEWLPAPRINASVRIEAPMNHAQILYNCGYDSSQNVHSLLAAWRTLFSLLGPDRVVCDYAPTARLAARSLDIDVASIDSGFSMPPLPPHFLDPLPLVRVDSIPDWSQLVKSERQVLDVVNLALNSLRASPLAAFSSIFRGEVWYRNWPDLNHFFPHSPEKHLGQIFGDVGGVDPVWPSGTQPKIFAYLKPGHANSLSILDAAVRCGYRVLAYLPGFPDSAIKNLTDTGRVSASKVPINLGRLPDDVDIGIWHSPTGGIARCLDKGMRMLFLPTNSEQNLACAAARTAGLPVHIHTTSQSDCELLETVRSAPTVLLGDRWLPADVGDFAHKLAGGARGA